MCVQEGAKALQKGKKKKGGEEEEVAELGICTTPDTVRSSVYSVQPCWAKKPSSNTRHSLVVKVTISLDRRKKTILEIQKLYLIAERVFHPSWFSKEHYCNMS